ncbi:hypothetical protein J2I47_26190 [Fibrella sp. HMF5335]|uniref:Uncharacterized protein n=1 Tax=Fibrella rubiginis TaxID=2817060 RepID=A0A939GIX9_9BACT|nr:hypothetical protein [Fibrella rubiginis]MBO0940062.1 hypothetical protein [Fibrella rubiginis]
MISLSPKFKKVAIIYFSINLFALFVNLVGLEGCIYSPIINSNDTSNLTNPTIYLFAEQDVVRPSLENNFWPFTSFVEEVDFAYMGNHYKQNYYRGIFADYNMPEFLFYLIVPILYFFYKRSSDPKFGSA